MNQSNSKRQIYLAQFYRKNKLAYFFAALSAILLIACNLILSWVMQQIIDNISGVDHTLSLSQITLFSIGMILFVIVMKLVNYYSCPRFIRNAILQYKEFAFRNLTRKNIATFQNESSSSYLSGFTNDVNSIEENYLSKQFDMITNLILFFGALLMMLWYSPLLTFIAIALSALPFAASILTGSRLGQLERQVSDQNAAFTITLKDILSGFSVVKSFKAESSIYDIFSQSNEQVEGSKYKKRKVATIIQLIGMVTGIIAQLGVFIAGAYLTLSGYPITAGVIIAFVNLMNFIITPIAELPGIFASRKAALGLIDKMAEALDQNRSEEGYAISNNLESGIELQNLSFGYEENQEILHNISTTFESGKSYCLVGGSGCGKSTLLNLLMASHTNYSGHICFDGHELKEINPASIYELTSVIQQNVFLFHATIRDNITMFQSFPDEMVNRVIELSGLTSIIEKHGADYLCGEDGVGLSGGEKQRISIARSLLRNSSVLLVDEATSALDAETSYQISSVILGLKSMTRIVITHDLDESILKNYDCILTMKAGEIVESGDFHSLMEKKGYFYSLFTVSQ